MNIYVGNLNSQTTEEQLRNLFTPFGEISSLRIITDKYSNQSKGFGFVEMQDQGAGQQAITALQSTIVDGHSLTVNEAKPKPDRYHGYDNTDDTKLKRRF